MSNDLPIIVFEPRAGHQFCRGGDCACADNLTASSPGLSIAQFDPTVTYQRASRLYRLPLAENRTLLIDGLSSSCAVLNQSALTLLDSFAAQGNYPTMESLHSLEAVRTLVELGFLAPVSPAHGLPEQSSLLTVWLQVTDQCNLACQYCYRPRSNGAMSADVGRASVDTAFRSAQHHGFQSVKLKYAGGEPTLNFSRILDMQDHAVELAALSGISLEAVVLTNGVGLTPHMIDELKSRAMPVMISLDGIGPLHDIQRHYLNGRGSFDCVIRTIEQLIAAGHPPQISVTVTERNISGLAKTLEWILDHGLQFNLNFYRESEHSASFEDFNLNEEHLIEEMRQAYSVIARQLPPYSLVGSLLDRTHFFERHEYACGATRNYLVINQQGEVSLCHMQLDSPVTDVWSEDPLAGIRSTHDKLINLSIEERANCRECTWRYWCAGGCPLITFRRTNRWDTSSPYCRIYQALLPEVLKLEGLRLLKYYSVEKIN